MWGRIELFFHSGLVWVPSECLTTELGIWDRGEGAQGIVMLADIAGSVIRAMGEELTLLGRIQERREAE